MIKSIIFSRVSSASRAQIEPFYLFKESLVNSLNFHFEEIPVDSLSDIDIEKANLYDIVFVQRKIPSRYKSQLNEIFNNINGKKVLLDDRDSSGQCTFSAIPFIDLYIKKQVLSDINKYSLSYPDGRIHADFIYRSSSKDLPPCQRINIPLLFGKKLFAGWNIGAAKHLYSQITTEDHLYNTRPIDISLRLRLKARSLKDNHIFDWYYNHRKQCMDEIQRLDREFLVVTSETFVLGEEYRVELRRSKICPSPWGLGEICYRDFEAIVSGALLVKPPMDHLITSPNIYIPYETYIPSKVDFSDLADICRYYIVNDNERIRITRNALKTYREYFEKQTFVSQIADAVHILFPDPRENQRENICLLSKDRPPIAT